MNRPLLIYTSAYILGIICSQNLKYTTTLILSVIFFIFSTAMLKNKKILRVLMFAIIIVNISSFYTEYKGDSKRSEILNFTSKQVHLKGTFVSMLKKGEDSITFTAYIYQINNSKIAKEKVRVNYYSKNLDNTNFNYGEVIQIGGNVELPKSIRNPGGFDYRKYLLANNIYAIVNAKSVFTIEGEENRGNPLARLSLSIKDRLAFVIQSCLKGRQAALLEGIVLSKTDNLDEKNKE